jgi:uncharacterized membrane protein YidH (DUF202 family)
VGRVAVIPLPDGPQETYQLAGDPDGGFARERTELAWSRSGLAVVVVVAIVLRRLWPLSDTDTLVVLLVLAAGFLVWATGMFLVVRKRRASTGSVVMGETACRLLTFGTVALAGAGVLLALFTRR